jgi:hypothetical protein
MDDKMYVVMRADYTYDEVDCYPLGAAMSKEAANVHVCAYVVDDGKLVEEEQARDGTMYRHFECSPYVDSAVYVTVVPAI